MKFVFIIFLSLFSQAGVITDNIPVDGRYKDAVDNLSDALYIQTGAKMNVDMFRMYMENEVRGKITKIGLEKQLGTALYLYNLYKTRTIQTRIYGKTVTLTPNSISVTFDI